MSFLLVPVSVVRDALRIDEGESDALLEIYISAASRAVVEYLKGEAGDFLSINSPPDSPPDDLSAVDERVRFAVIALTGVMYRNPDNDEAEEFSHGNLPWFITAMLYPLRTPTVA
jgi:hypothetical protein